MNPCGGIVYFIHERDFEKIKTAINIYKENTVISMSFALGVIIYTGVFIKILSDRYNQSSVNAFKSNIQIPENLRQL